MLASPANQSERAFATYRLTQGVSRDKEFGAVPHGADAVTLHPAQPRQGQFGQDMTEGEELEVFGCPSSMTALSCSR